MKGEVRLLAVLTALPHSPPTPGNVGSNNSGSGNIGDANVGSGNVGHRNTKSGFVGTGNKPRQLA